MSLQASFHQCSPQCCHLRCSCRRHHRLKKWDDAAIKALNPDVKLPSADIVVVHRSDGSGTTFGWTNYLSKVSADCPLLDAVINEIRGAWKIVKGADGKAVY